MKKDIHTEAAFETTITSHLSTHGYSEGSPEELDQERSLFQNDLFTFIQETQSKLWSSLEKQHGDGLRAGVLDALVKTLESRGTLDVLRHGFKFYGKPIKLAYFKPAFGLNPEAVDKYNRNRLTVTRQVEYIRNDQRDSKVGRPDIVISLNGLPVVTMELKNQMTGQDVENARKQYMYDRNPRDTLFRFKRGALVHFAVDTDSALMTTKLQHDRTVFLPFNKGKAGGAGNPENPKGHRTAYLWEQVLERDSFLDIIERFMHLQVEEKKKDGKVTRKETMIFPRFHQLDAVRKLVTHSRETGAGKNYLVQHSAGSGKSNSIAWLAHHLANLHNKQDEKVFDSVVVITDRVVLDKQLQDTIYQFEHAQGVVEKIDKDSTQLANALQKGTLIIITTLQKFPFVTEKVGQLPDRRYAVIVDEAHSSQGGETAVEMKAVLSGAAIEEELEDAREELDDDPPTYEDELIKHMLARKKRDNLSFFGFTATPKAKTLETFGVPGPDGKPIPFHLYSMRQAIEEGFILDVLKNYTTYKTYYGLIKAIENDPKVEKKKATQALARFMSLHPHNIYQKTEVIIEHFRHHTRHRIQGKAKAMVVTSSRLHAVRYKLAFDKYIKEKGYTDLKTLVAFSGKVIDKEKAGIEYTEVSMNQGLREKELPEKFSTPEYGVLIVAEKYQTGFDQPLLHTMYVDKRLKGVHAVQTLSRLNRYHPQKDETFVLDFINEWDDIQKAFQPFYEMTTVTETTDPQQLEDLKTKLDGKHVYFQSEVEQFCKILFKAEDKKSPADNARLNAAVNPAVDRYNSLEEEDQDEFKKDLRSYVKLYSFVSQVIPWIDPELEKLSAYGRMLLKKLPREAMGIRYDFVSDVSLKYYRLELQGEQDIVLTKGEEGQVAPATEVGTGKAKDEEVELSSIIEVLNEKFGTEFTKTDQLLFDQVKADLKVEEEVIATAKANTLDNFKLVFTKLLEQAFLDRIDRNQDIVQRFLDNDRFRETVENALTPQVYREVREETQSG
ncbi:MAG: type I restriction endonuclease subunit R [Proteobacteria bacterium]|nr:type I restriction endonuclease subunit R [Pseudomonadota bacterium]